MTSLDDTQLVTSFVAGNAKAFDEIVHRYRPLCYGIALNWLRNHEDAEEVSNDVFIRAHRSLACFRGDCALKSWLWRIAVRLSVNRYKHRRSRRLHLSDSIFAPMNFEGMTLEQVLPSGEQSVPDFLETEELDAEIHAALPGLSTKHRDILVLRAFRHCEYEEISVQLGIGVGTTKSRLSRARESLRSRLPAEMLA